MTYLHKGCCSSWRDHSGIRWLLGGWSSPRETGASLQHLHAACTGPTTRGLSSRGWECAGKEILDGSPPGCDWRVPRLSRFVFIYRTIDVWEWKRCWEWQWTHYSPIHTLTANNFMIINWRQWHTLLVCSVHVLAVWDLLVCSCWPVFVYYLIGRHGIWCFVFISFHIIVIPKVRNIHFNVHLAHPMSRVLYICQTQPIHQ